MDHYVCPACGGVSETPKNCGTEGCSLQGRELKTCHCEDNQHQETKAQKK